MKIAPMLETLAAALNRGDARAAATCWDVPGLVLADQGALAIQSVSEVERFFERSIKAYRAQGVATTRPEIRVFERLSDGLAIVDVEWPGFDSSGKEISRERSFYIVHAGEDGAPRIQVALTRTR